MQPSPQEAFLFRFLSQAFAYPNQAFIPQLRESCGMLDNTRAASARTLIEAFSKEEMVPLQAEYTRLFINGYPKTPCPPYASVWLENRMLGNASIDAQEAYREWDMTVDAGILDHLSTEFEFLAFLASARSLEGKAGKTAGESLEKFFSTHLCRWVPKLVEAMQKEAALAPYRILSEMLETLLRQRCPALKA